MKHTLRIIHSKSGFEVKYFDNEQPVDEGSGIFRGIVINKPIGNPKIYPVWLCRGGGVYSNDIVDYGRTPEEALSTAYIHTLKYAQNKGRREKLSVRGFSRKEREGKLAEKVQFLAQ